MSNELEEALPAAIRAWDRVRRPNEQRRPFSAGFRTAWTARGERVAALEAVDKRARALSDALDYSTINGLPVPVARAWSDLIEALDAAAATDPR